MKQIALALHNYAQRYNALPPAYTVDSNGDPLHSWRTLILPYLEQQTLYDSIDLSKAWNDPANEEAAKADTDVYRCPSSECPESHTGYLAVTVSGGCFRNVEPRQLAEITDPHSETLMLIEVGAEHAVHWMSPLDADDELVLSLGPETGLPHSGGWHGACVDGRVEFLDAEMSAAQRRAWISIAGDDG